MEKRYLAIWFRYLKTDWFTRRQPLLRKRPFVLAAPDHGRIIITEPNLLARKQGALPGMVVADARAMIPGVEVMDDKPQAEEKLLKGLAEWCIRFTPVVAADLPAGLLLDVTGCAHLWGGEENYIATIQKRLHELGYNCSVAMADTIGAAWAVSRFVVEPAIIPAGRQMEALLPLPPSGLRLDDETVDKCLKLGLYHIRDFIKMPKPVLRRRFGKTFLLRLGQALGTEEEFLEPVFPTDIFEERLPCLEPIATAAGIEMALKHLLEATCKRLQRQEKGLRTALFKCYRLDGKIEKQEIGTLHPSHQPRHLFHLFKEKIGNIEPDLGIELFTLEAQKLEDLEPVQEQIWQDTPAFSHTELSKLLDRIAGKTGANTIHRYLPDEHYWPERSFREAATVAEEPVTVWRTDKLRPLRVLSVPEKIEVAAPIPDYPPMHFRYRGKLHKITRADGPERIEQEWWIEDGEHRDYYCVEDEDGCRYWLFRLGHYRSDRSHQWFLHGFFA